MAACQMAAPPVAPGEKSYEVYYGVDGPVAILTNGGADADVKLKSFIASMCEGKYRVEPRITQCVEACDSSAFHAIAYECEES